MPLPYSWLFAFLYALAAALAAPLKVRLNPANVNNANQPEPDYTTWTISQASSSTITIGNVTLSLLAPDGTILSGGSNKLVLTRVTSSLGERIIGQGISTSSTAGGPISLTVRGLPAGNHNLLAYHNAWDNLPEATNISVSVDGNRTSQNQLQTIRSDNIWDASASYVNLSLSSADQIVNITYAPFPSNLADSRVFLNAFELDTANIKDQPSFPSPSHRDEHTTGSSVDRINASWKTPRSAGNASYPRYDVYFAGGTPDNLAKLSSAQAENTVTFSRTIKTVHLSSLETYYWRVDSISQLGRVDMGRIWTFRLRQLAFPGAEGYGRFARGGRGGKIVKVTRLDDYDSASSPIEGTIRHALTAVSGPRTVIFDIGGVITLTSRLTIRDNYITVAGQTAPGKGIAIRGWPIGLSGASDVIIRHLRVRPGKIFNRTIDGMGMQGSNHAIFDRCSVGWAIDECFSSRSAANITLQRSMISEPLNIAGHQNYPAGKAHGFAASIGGDVGSFHHNLIAHAWGRSWSMAGGLDAAGYFAGKLDIRNNVVFNFGERVTDGGAHQTNFVSNYYKPGPSSLVRFALKAQYEDDMPGQQQYYCAGNSMPGFFKQGEQQIVDVQGNETDANVIGACWAKITISPEPIYQKFVLEPFFESFVQTQSSTEAYKRVLSDSGAQQPMQDAHDRRIIFEVVNGTTTYNGSVSGLQGIIDNEADVGGLEEFPEVRREQQWDTDGDGIADWWDGSNGGDPGWTALDGYLNFMADPHVFVAPGASLSIDLQQYSSGFVKPVHYTAEAERGDVEVKGTTASYTAAGLNSGVDIILIRITDSEGSSWKRTIGVAIFEGAQAN
ncbi:polysaccharide lyase family 1 protein [Zopfia rhizophila CBS 207.26]|uniref:Polysaccharide lyase family 1 protein n=1 Tax=Zopfia rhizophila CBS 207.26 TaxID=1314779 RepID=A0A6A6E070_9PEZI|nr:polysaccharide lyase family 1 protein [Zopfia rhizophila CBS 207.26]